MPGLWDSLTVGSRGLQAQQTGAQITGANIANYNVDGYHREDPTITSSSAFRGVQQATLKRASQGYLEANYNRAQADQEFTATRARQLVPMNAGVGDQKDETGLTSRLGQVFAAFKTLSSGVNQVYNRTQVLAQLQMFATSVNNDAQALSGQAKQLDHQIINAVTDINAQAAVIGNLNSAITTSQAQGNPAADLMDQRDLAVGRLASLAGATVSVQSNGEYTVLVGAGITLVDNSQVNRLGTTLNTATGLHDVVMPGTELGTLNGRITGGSMGANLQVRDGDLTQAATMLDQLAYDTANALNAQHTAGYDLNGTAGVNLFVPPATVAGAAAGLKVNSALLGNPQLLAGSQTAGAGTRGDNRNAVA
ncbi:MAG: flagellar hook-associated protein FlgK, partial [Deltaproteobacteria bacterium]